MDRYLLSNRSLWVKINKVDKKGVVMVGICYRPLSQEKEVDWKNSSDFWLSQGTRRPRYLLEGQHQRESKQSRKYVAGLHQG